ncbi:uncharacterized protein LOC121937383 [Sceloporus undulatus]|uniref:uncharacterized protein LOC121937383 n=1 Tax=Sceloporus undulatus TaxID=8520 RepID=UPI001C4B40BB|nr:uncharacterized protein LOC121937383 [Sceloporus undulatus]
MAGFSKTFLLFSIFITSHLCQETDSTDRQKLRQDLLIAVMCIFLVLLIMLIAGCTFLHYKLMTKDITTNNYPVNALKTDLKPYAIQTRCVETKIVLSPSQDNHLYSPEWTPSQLPSHQLPNQRPPQRLSQKPRRLSSPNPEDPEPEESNALLPEEKSSMLSISRIYRSHSSESVHSDSSGSVYSQEHFELLYLSSRSESLQDEKVPQVTKEHEESAESGSFMLCAIHKK